MSKPSKSLPAVVAEICMYGTRAHGFDYLARHAGGFTAGSWDSRGAMRFDSATILVWRAVDELREAGLVGLVAIHTPDGERTAIVDLANVPAFGDLRFVRAAAYEAA